MRIKLKKENKYSAPTKGMKSVFGYKSFYVIISHVREIISSIPQHFNLRKWGPKRAAVVYDACITENQSYHQDPTSICIFKDLSICIYFYYLVDSISVSAQYLLPAENNMFKIFVL